MNNTRLFAWQKRELMYEVGISPFGDSLTAETLDAEVKSADKIDEY